MVEENRLDVLQDEIKLLKAEVKNSLASVRDYLLNMELPSSEFSTILAALSGDNADPQKMNVDSHVSGEPVADTPKPKYGDENLDGDSQPGEFEDMLDFEEAESGDEIPEDSPEKGALFEEGEPIDNAHGLPQEEIGDDPFSDEAGTGEEDLLPEEDSAEEETKEPEDELDEPEDALEESADEPEDEDNPEDEKDELPEEDLELPMEEVEAMEQPQPVNDVNSGIPKVNMLANLINWVAKARQEIGQEELPTFLEVYGTTGHLSPELKDIIIHLAEIVKDHAEVASEPEIWSQAMLSLHGILTGGDAPLNPVVPSWVDTTDEEESLAEDEVIEVDKAKEKQAKLKLVFPGANGKSKEFCIDLTPEENGDGSS